MMNLEIRPSIDEKGILIILVDGTEWKKVHTSIWKKSKIPPCKDEQQLHQSLSQMEYRLAKQYTLACLSLKNYSSYELQKKLSDKRVNSVCILQIIEEYKKLGLIDDKLWIDNFIKQEIRKKNGPKIIYQKLLAKGVDAQFAKEQLSALEDDHSQKESIKQLLSTKYRKLDLHSFKDRQKVIQALLRKGFSYSTIQETLMHR